MRRVSGSSLGLAVACTASHVLPSTDTSNEAATQRGTALHKYMADAIAGGREEALARVPAQYLQECASIDLAFVDGICRGAIWIGVEVAFVLDTRTGTPRLLGAHLDRNYGQTAEHEIPMTADLILSFGNRGIVVDWKSGITEGDPWQLRACAAAAAAHFGWTETRAMFAYIRPDGSIEQGETLDLLASDLDAQTAVMRGALAAVAAGQRLYLDGATISTVEGKHCTWCPARFSCPSKTALIRKVLSMEARPDLAALNLHEAGALYARLVEFERFAQRMRAEFETLAEQAPIPLPDGSELRLVEGNEYLDSEVAYQVVEHEYGTERALRAARITMSKDKLRKALGIQEAHKALDRIRAAGGLRRGERLLKVIKKAG